MKIRTIIFLLLIFWPYLIIAQKDDESINFLNDYVKDNTKNEIIYTDKIWSGDLTKIKTALSKEIVQYRDIKNSEVNNEFPEKILFTKKELKFVLKEITKNDRKSWAKNKVLGSQFIARDTIESYLQKKSSLYNYYSFSKPIFLRKNSICIFYFDGNESGRLATYVKINGKWKYYAMFFYWIS